MRQLPNETIYYLGDIACPWVNQPEKKLKIHNGTSSKIDGI